LVIGKKRSNSGGVVAAATWYQSLAMDKIKNGSLVETFIGGSQLWLGRV
jgi:hypothetical protein